MGRVAVLGCSALLDCGEASTNQHLIPERAILIEKQDGRAVRADARTRPRRLNLHQRDEAMHFRFVRHQAREDAPQTQRVFAERRPHPVVTRCRRVALVEDQVNHFEHGRQSVRRARHRLAPRRGRALSRVSSSL